MVIKKIKKMKKMRSTHLLGPKVISFGKFGLEKISVSACMTSPPPQCRADTSAPIFGGILVTGSGTKKNQSSWGAKATTKKYSSTGEYARRPA